MPSTGQQRPRVTDRVAGGLRRAGRRQPRDLAARRAEAMQVAEADARALVAQRACGDRGRSWRSRRPRRSRGDIRRIAQRARHARHPARRVAARQLAGVLGDQGEIRGRSGEIGRRCTGRLDASSMRARREIDLRVGARGEGAPPPPPSPRGAPAPPSRARTRRGSRARARPRRRRASSRTARRHPTSRAAGRSPAGGDRAEIAAKARGCGREIARGLSEILARSRRGRGEVAARSRRGRTPGCGARWCLLRGSRGRWRCCGGSRRARARGTW